MEREHNCLVFRLGKPVLNFLRTGARFTSAQAIPHLQAIPPGLRLVLRQPSHGLLGAQSSLSPDHVCFSPNVLSAPDSRNIFCELQTMKLGHRRNVRACILVLAGSAALLVAVTFPSFVLQGGDNVELEETDGSLDLVGNDKKTQLAQDGEQCWMCPCCAGCEATAAARATGCDLPKAKAVHGEAKKQKERDAAQHALNLANGRIKLLQAKLEQAKLASKNQAKPAGIGRSQAARQILPQGSSSYFHPCMG